MSDRTVTWREAIANACAEVDQAKERRKAVFIAARDAGLTLRAIASAADVSLNTVWTICGGKAERADLLDAPAPKDVAS